MKLDAFRKIIREEVRGVIKEELSLIMSTPITETKVVKKPVVEQKVNKPSFSEIVNEEVVQQKQPTFEPTGNPMLDILNETAAAGEWRSLNGGYNSSHAAGFAGGIPGGCFGQVGTAGTFGFGGTGTWSVGGAGGGWYGGGGGYRSGAGGGRVGEHVELPRLKSIAPKRKRRILLQRCVAREHTRGVRLAEPPRHGVAA